MSFIANVDAACDIAMLQFVAMVAHACIARIKTVLPRLLLLFSLYIETSIIEICIPVRKRTCPYNCVANKEDSDKYNLAQK
jgi:hypothetical protein